MARGSGINHNVSPKGVDLKAQYAQRALISLLFLSKMVELLSDYENLVCTSQHTNNNDHSLAFWGK